MRCPKCTQPFKEDRLDGMPVQVCSSCNGIWFDREKIKAYLGQALERTGHSPALTHLREEEPAPTDLICPVCREQWLTAIKPHGVEIEQCSGCRGVFLDPGEIDLLALQSISDAVDRRATAPAPLRTNLGSAASGIGNVVKADGFFVLEIILELLD